MARATGCGPVDREFNSPCSPHYYLYIKSLLQLAETLANMIYIGELPERTIGAIC